MVFNQARLRVKELAKAMRVEIADIIAVCTILAIPASSAISSLSIDQCKEIINYLEKEV